MFSDFNSSLFCLYILRINVARSATPTMRKHLENTGLSALRQNFFQSSSLPYASFALLILAAAAKVQIKQKQR
jgi:hypothetical protein